MWDYTDRLQRLGSLLGSVLCMSLYIFSRTRPRDKLHNSRDKAGKTDAQLQTTVILDTCSVQHVPQGMKRGEQKVPQPNKLPTQRGGLPHKRTKGAQTGELGRVAASTQYCYKSE